MKRITALFIGILLTAGAWAQDSIEVTQAQAKSLYKTINKKWVSVHDPSVVWEPTSQRYYIFGSHRGVGYTTDMQNWTSASQTWQAGSNSAAFVTPAVKKVKKGGVEIDFPQFNAMEWSARTDASYNIDGNMWAPDVLWNPVMQKWCMYLSINGDAWHSSIILLTSSNITGPYQYQGPVVICGFQDNGHSYKGTDLELVLGTQASLPSRYNVGSNWGRRWPHTIDPAAFYDEEGKLWLVYGSWSGGIWMLELDEETGLRDYDVVYPSTNGSSDGVTSDPYFGTKVGGGYYVSGEGPYIEHIGQYYYLFVSYGFYSPDGGYEMRVFRSEHPNGPYKDAQGRSAIFTSYVMNYGTGSSDMRGEKLMGAYNNWGFMTVGECAQGHNSIIAAADGRTYLVYHTKFNDGTVGHKVRVHQVFQNKNGWLVAAPFEYNGETATDADIATQQLVASDEIPGTYQLLVHKYRMDYANYEEVTPVEICLTADGKVTGAYSGTWSLEPNTSYLSLKLGSTNYNGVMIEEQMDSKTIKTIAFTAMATNGVNVWGYKYRPEYALAWQLNNQKSPISTNVMKSMDLYALHQGDPNVQLSWQSNHPEVISNEGMYYPIGLQEDMPVTLTARLSAGRYFWQQSYNVTAMSEANSQTTIEWNKGLLARYNFDTDDLANTQDPTQQAQLQRNGTTQAPKLVEGEPLRNGKVVQLNFGANKKESYVSMPNPLKGLPLTDGATIAFFVKRADNNLWDALFGMANGDARLFLTGNLYLGFNSGTGNYIDINHPNTVQTEDLGTGRWHLVTITFDRKKTSTGGMTIYIDAQKRTTDKYEGKLNGNAFSTKTGFDYNLVVDHLAACDQLFLGNGSYWGSPSAMMDEVMVFDHVLASYEINAMLQMTNRSFTPGSASGIDELLPSTPSADRHMNALYDLQGRRVNSASPQPGIYVRNGKKYLIRK